MFSFSPIIKYPYKVATGSLEEAKLNYLNLNFFLFVTLKDCKDFHPAKDGDGWVEQSSQPLLFGMFQKVCDCEHHRCFYFYLF